MRWVISWLIVVLSFTGCATPEFAPIKDPTVRIESYGFSILPPQGSGWYRREDMHLEGSDIVAIGKQSGSKTHTISVVLARHTGFNPALVGFAEYATNPEVFVAYVKSNALQKNPPGSRMRFLDLSAVPDTELGYCVKVHAKFEDFGSPMAPQILIQEDWDYSCLHPDSSRVIIEIGFSERGLPGENDPSLTYIREQFFKSFHFRPLQVNSQ